MINENLYPLVLLQERCVCRSQALGDGRTRCTPCSVHVDTTKDMIKILQACFKDGNGCRSFSSWVSETIVFICNFKWLYALSAKVICYCLRFVHCSPYQLPHTFTPDNITLVSHNTYVFPWWCASNRGVD